MPDVQAVLRAYDLQRGSTVGQCHIINSTGIHNVVLRYHDYSYTFTLTLDCRDSQHVLTYLNSRTHIPKVVNSHYGNPYLCTISAWRLVSQNGGYLTVEANGHSHRQE